MMIKRFLYVFVSVASLVIFSGASAYAAKPVTTSGGPNATAVGMDVSWPQCNNALPTSPVFGIVGINGGTAATQNPCLASQLAWANSLSGSIASQDKVQVYVNTANPGEVIGQITTWPTSNTAPVTNPYGICDGTNTHACSWQYGWNRGEYAVNYFQTEALNAGLVSTNPANYKWWLDVETGNTWQGGSTAAYERNVASLEGWVAYFTYINARTGIYSTATQWGQITSGAVGPTSNLNGLNSWLAGSKTLNGAKTKCTYPPLTTGGQVVLSQYVSGGYDYNHSCI